MKSIIITDSCCDLWSEYVKENNIVVAPLVVTINENDYKDNLGKSLSYEEFYENLREGKLAHTAQVNVYTFQELYKTLIKEGYNIIHISFSSALSGTYNSACIAREEVLEEFPTASIKIIDSKCASMGLGLLVHYANELLKDGKTDEEIVDWIENNKLKINHWFTVEDLNHLYRGGRVSKTVATVGTLLNIKPVMNVNDDGKLMPVLKAKGRKKAISTIISKVEELIINPEEQVIFISHGDALEEAEQIKEAILKKLNVKDVMINYIGPAVGTHSGPATLAVFFLGEKR